MIASPCPLLGFAAFSGTGKTSLLEKLIPELRAAGVRPALIKHSHHCFDVDQKGKDSYRLRKAGADQVLLASDVRLALMIEKVDQKQTELANLIPYIDTQVCDLILVEGFRDQPFPKIELHRSQLKKPLLNSS